VQYSAHCYEQAAACVRCAIAWLDERAVEGAPCLPPDERPLRDQHAALETSAASLLAAIRRLEQTHREMGEEEDGVVSGGQP
jgi:hypothetical protein